MTLRLLVLVPLVSVAFMSPASANWFYNPTININLNIGSAPNPTPEDIGAMRQPVLVRDAEGNVIAMVDPASGKVLATAEPAAPASPRNVPAKPPAATPVR